jgi:hypothetical protein
MRKKGISPKSRKRRRANKVTGTNPQPATRNSQLPPSVQSIVERGLTVRSYAVRADSWRDSDRSFEAVVATDLPIEVFDFREWEPIDEILVLAGMRTVPNGQVPLCDTHDRSSIDKQLGSCRGIRVEGHNLVARNFISSAEEKAATKVREKHVTDCSIGYIVHHATDIAAGETLEVNGTTYTAGPNKRLRISYDWELVENSILPVGADALAKIRQKPPAAQPDTAPHGDYFQKEETRMKEFKKWVEDKGFDPEELSDAQGQTLRSLYDREKAEEAPPDPPDKNDKSERDKPAESAPLTPGEALRRDVLAIVPTDLRAFAEDLILRDKALTVETAREKLLAEAARLQKPVGSPEPPDPPTRKKETDVPKKMADVDDDTLKRSLKG